MNMAELQKSHERLKSFQKIQILREIEMSYCEVVSDMELALDAMLSNVSTKDAFYRWGFDESLYDDCDRIAS